MEQVYYTQCPMGYGLGASNGYQVKRITPDYPASSDFRHLTLRAFLPGTRTMSPATLRYRRDGDVGEVAYMTPRQREFETEKGLWGRPGGHFAHGLRLDAQELAIIHEWPAGLYGSPIWKRGDPEATRGRMPEFIALETSSLTTEPTLEAVACLGHGLTEPELTHLLALTARVTRESRTLYVIGSASRLPAIMAVITFAFPPRLRSELTFSTFHDRPEELAGLRIQGIPPEARPNPSQLLGSGLVVDLGQATDRGLSSPMWARTIAHWFMTPTAAESRDFQVMCDHVARAEWDGAEIPWTDDWLDNLIAFTRRAGDPGHPPSSREDWIAFRDTISWASTAGLAADLAQSYPSDWWERLPRCGDADLPREALLGLLGSAGVLDTEDLESWARSLGSWYSQADLGSRHEAIARLWKSIPRGRRSVFLRGMLREVPSRSARPTLDWVRRLPGMRESEIRPLETSIEARSVVEGGDPIALRSILVEGSPDQSLINTMLDALSAEAIDGNSIETLAEVVGESYAMGEDTFRSAVEMWALSAESRAEVWLSPAITQIFQMGVDPQVWERLRRRLSASRLARLTPLAMRSALRPSANPQAFLWVVERLLLALPDEDRPGDPSWADAYLERIGSEIDLLNTLYQPKRAALKAWIYAARDRAEISSRQIERIERVRGYTRALQSRDAEMLGRVPLPVIPPIERGHLLSQMLDYLDPSALPSCLERCRDVWPGAFEPGAPGLAELAVPIAQALASRSQDAASWLLHLEDVLQRVGQLANDATTQGGYEHNGLAAHILAATHDGQPEVSGPWALRRFLLRDDRRWRILAADAARHFSTLKPVEAHTHFLRWRDQMAPGEHIKRFTEIVLNACSGPAMTAVVQTFASDLKTLGPIPWWASVARPSATNDVREAYAQMVTMGPIENEPLAHIDMWMRQGMVPLDERGAAEPDLVPVSALPESPAERITMISELARNRWLCVKAISALHRVGESVPTRLNQLNDWVRGKLPVGSLSNEDLARFLAWMIQALPPEEIDHVGNGGGWLAVERFATWVARESTLDPDACLAWGQYLPEVPSTSDPRQQVARALRRAVHQCRMEARESQANRHSNDSL